MRNNTLAFDIHDNIGPWIPVIVPIGYMKVTIHIIFDVELYPGFTYKAGIVAYGNKVDTPPYMTYASSESRYIVIIILLLADFNVLDVQCTNVQNSFLNADPKDILYL